MMLTKCISSNILFLLGNFILILSVPFFISSLNYDGTNNIYGVSLYEHCFTYSAFIFLLIIIIPIELMFHKLTKNKFILNIPLKNKSIICTYYILFWLGIISSILYLTGYLWFVSKLTP